MYHANLIRVHRIERDMTEFPRATIENHPMSDKRCFKLTLRSDYFRTGSDGSLHIWMDRADVSNLQLDCSNQLLDHDIENGTVSIAALST